jgi:AraC family transcriptional regulator
MGENALRHRESRWQLTADAMNWFNASTGTDSNMPIGRLGFQTHALCEGMTLHFTSDPSGELPEGYFVNHVLVLTTRAPDVLEWSFPGTGWRRWSARSSLMHFRPARVPFAARWQGEAAAILLEMTSEFVARARAVEDVDFSELAPWDRVEEGFLREATLALSSDRRGQTYAGQRYAELLGAAIVGQLFREADGASSVEPAGGLRPRVLQRILDHIEAHLAEDLSLASLADLAQMGIDQFARLFKRSTAKTPHQYVLRKRVEHAKGLLMTSGLGTAEIAARCGFADQSHLNRVFRQSVGQTPRDFREARSH